MQRLCNQAKAVMELARGYQKEDQYQAYSGSAGYSNGRGSVASIPDVIPFDIAQSSPPRSSMGVTSSATAGVPGSSNKFEDREREAVNEGQLRFPLVEDQPGMLLSQLPADVVVLISVVGNGQNLHGLIVCTILVAS